MPTPYRDGEIEPTISILMGVYQPIFKLNALRDAVASILTQTFGDFEFLICDDGSCEEVLRYLESVAAADRRVRLIRSPKALTLPQKLNLCLGAARGQWIARQDDDDLSSPQRLEKELAFLETHPQYAFVGCNVELRMADGGKGERILPQAPTVRDFIL